MGISMNSRMSWRARVVVAVALVGGLSAACDSHTATGPGTLASISVTPNVTLAIKASQQFIAVGKDAAGAVVDISPTWSMEAGGGTISVGGLFTAGTSTGTFTSTVKATSGGISGTATVTVTNGAVASITVTPTPINVNSSGTQQFAAVGKDAGGNEVAISSIWSVVGPGGTISALGLFTAGTATGTFPNTVKASSGGYAGFATVTVLVVDPHQPPVVTLGSAAVFAVLGSTAVSCIGVTSIAGDVGVAPSGSVSGFPAPCTILAPGAATPHLNDVAATTAQADVTPAFNALAALPCGTSLQDMNLGGMTLAPGVYCYSSSAQLDGQLFFDAKGDPSASFVIQVASALTTGTSAQVTLIGGAQAKNIWWQVGSSATLGQTTAFQGNIIAGVSVTLVQGASLHGRALSKAGVTMDTNIITLP
jgi:hypothetical protein